MSINFIPPCKICKVRTYELPGKSETNNHKICPNHGLIRIEINRHSMKDC